MGLNRFFSLSAEKKYGDGLSRSEAQEIEKELNELCGGWYGTLADYDDLRLDGASWYEWEEDMGAIAAAHPEILFTLFCSGDSLNDTWTAGFCADRFDHQVADIPPLDLNFLIGEDEK